MKVFEIVPTTERPWSETNVLSRTVLDQIQKRACPELSFTDRQLEYVSRSCQELVCDAVDDLLLLASHRANQGPLKITINDVNILLEASSSRSSGITRVRRMEN